MGFCSDCSVCDDHCATHRTFEDNTGGEKNPTILDFRRYTTPPEENWTLLHQNLVGKSRTSIREESGSSNVEEGPGAVV